MTRNNLIKSLEPILILGTFVGVCPYLLNIGKIRKNLRRHDKLLNIITKVPILTVIIVSIIWGLPACRSHHKFSILWAIKVTRRYLHALLSANNFIFAFVNRRKMTQTLTRFAAVDLQLEEILDEINYKSSRRRLVVSLVLCGIASTPKYALKIFSAVSTSKLSFCVFIGVPSHLSMVILEFYLIILLHELKDRFRALNCHISGILNVSCSRMLSRRKLPLIVTNRTTEAIVRCSNIHSELCDIGRLINKSFEAQILLRIIQCSTTIMSTTISVVAGIKYFKNFKSFFRFWSAVTNTSGVFFLFYVFTTTAAEAKRTANILHTFYHERKFSEVITFSNQLYFKSTNFNIYELFPLDWPALYVLATTIFTYLLLLLQFSDVE